MIPNVAALIDNLFTGRRSPSYSGGASLENPALDLRDPATWDAILEQNGTKADSGLLVGPEQALRFGPVYQCCEIKSCDVATSTLHVHKTNVEPGEDDIDYNLPAERVCSLEWNEVTPAAEGWQNLVFHQQLWGNGYAYISRQGGHENGPIQWMANLVPTSVKPVYDEHEGLLYQVTVNGEDHFLYHWEVFHLKGLAITQHRALNLLTLMRNELGLALASKLYLSKFFERGGHHGGLLIVPPGMQKDARENLERGVQKRSDPKNWFKTLILRDGADWKSSTVDPQAAQMHELTDDEARAVCHFFNVPPYKLGIRDSESYNSAEMAARAYITGSLLHTCTRIQAEAQMKLLSFRTRRARTHEFRHNFSKLLEPDVKTMNEVLEIQRRNEIINANDWRRKIRLPERADAKADLYYNPNTRTDKKQAADAAAADDPDDGDGVGSGADEQSGNSASGRQQVLSTAAVTRLLDESLLRAARRLCTVARNKARKPNDLLRWCDLRAAEHASVVAEETQAALAVARGEKAGAVMVLATENWLLSRLAQGIGVYLEAPHKPADLQHNVDQFCQQFLAEVCDHWHKEILDHATQQ